MKSLKTLLAFTLLLFVATSSRGELITALTDGNLLVRVDSANPNSILGAPVSVTGLVASDSLFAIDFRPIDGVLVGLGYNSGAGTGRVYSINTSSGVATQILATNLPFGAGLTQFGFDFNPVANALRIVDPNGNNTRITTGGTGSVFADTAINPAGNNLVGLAYSNNTASAVTTTLFGAEANSSNLVIVNPPNNGTVSSVGSLGVTGSTVTGFDISGATATAYLSTNPSSGLSKLFTVNLMTGAATEVSGSNANGNIGGGLNIRDISVVPEPRAFLLIAAAGMISLCWKWMGSAVYRNSA